MIEALRRAKPEVAGGGGSLPGGYVAGGRLGVELPVDERDALRLGLAGSVVNANNFRKRMATGVDAEYRQGNQAIGLEWKKKQPGGFFEGQAFGGNPNELWLKYRRDF
jgi:hypothetical protein